MTSGNKMTVIIAVRNSARTLERALRSVFQQSYRNIELIVIDGGSSDGSLDIIDRYRARIAYTTSESDNGPYDAFNKGVDRATGEWILFLGSDDFLDAHGTLEEAATKLSRLPPDQCVAYGRIMLVTKDEQGIGVVGLPWRTAKQRFRLTMSIPHPATFHRRLIFEKHGRFNPSYTIAGDYEFLLRELKTADAADLGNFIVTRMTIGGLSSNPRHARIMLQENRRVRAAHGLGGNWHERLRADLLVRLRLAAHDLLGDRLAMTLDNGVRRLRGLPPWDEE